MISLGLFCNSYEIKRILMLFWTQAIGIQKLTSAIYFQDAKAFISTLLPLGMLKFQLSKFMNLIVIDQARTLHLIAVEGSKTG